MKKLLLVVLTVLTLLMCVACGSSNKPLWSGAWVDGEIKVNSASRYNVFVIEFEYGSMVATRKGNKIEGSAIYGHNVPNALAVFTLEIVVDGDNWELNRKMYAILSNNVDVKDSTMAITAIYPVE